MAVAVAVAVAVAAGVAAGVAVAVAVAVGVAVAVEAESTLKISSLETKDSPSEIINFSAYTPGVEGVVQTAGLSPPLVDQHSGETEPALTIQQGCK